MSMHNSEGQTQMQEWCGTQQVNCFSVYSILQKCIYFCCFSFSLKFWRQCMNEMVSRNFPCLKPSCQYVIFPRPSTSLWFNLLKSTISYMSTIPYLRWTLVMMMGVIVRYCSRGHPLGAIIKTPPLGILNLPRDVYINSKDDLP